jgi:hypothetical protein
VLSSLRLPLQRYVTGYPPVPRFVSRVKKRHRIAHTDPVAGDARFGVFFGKSDAELTHLSCPNFRSQGRTPTASVRYPGRRRRTSGVATRCAARTGVSGLQRSVRRGVWSVLDGAMLTPSATRKLLTGSFSREIFWLSLEEASTCFSGACSEGNVTAPGGNQFWAFPRRDQHPLRRLISSVAACVSVLVTL